jgi:hypothetical protein
MDSATITALHALVKDASLDPSIRLAAEANLLKALGGTAPASKDATTKQKALTFTCAMVHGNPGHNFRGEVDTSAGTKGQVNLISRAQHTEARRLLKEAIKGNGDATEMVRRAFCIINASSQRRVDKASLAKAPMDWDQYASFEVGVDAMKEQLAKMDKSQAETLRRKAGVEAAEPAVKRSRVKA